jgi:hypothetical protein
MYYSDHSPPHFHALYQGEEVQIAIQTLQVIAGKIPRRALALLLEWAALNREELQDAWARSSRNERPDKIPPLE